MILERRKTKHPTVAPAYCLEAGGYWKGGSQTEPSSVTDLRRLILVFEEANVAVILEAENRRISSNLWLSVDMHMN